MNVEDRDQDFAVASDGLMCQSRHPQWQGARANWGITKGTELISNE